MARTSELLPLATPPVHWSDPLWRWRDQLLTSPRFAHWAQAFAPTRWIAQRRAAQLFDLLAGFVYSQVLLACVRLKLLDWLGAQGPQTLPEIATHLGLPFPPAERLVRAAVALRLLEARPLARFGLGPLGAPMVGNAGLAALVEHHEALYRDLTDPVGLLRASAGESRGVPSGELAHFWPYAGDTAPRALGDDGVAAYSALMAASQPMVAEQILQAYPLHGHQRLLDVGGGEGAFVCAAAVHAPALKAVVFDLPAVAQRARQRFEAAGLAGRCEAVGGDFLRDELPRGADLISLVRVVHDHDDARVFALLDAARRALPAGGRLLLAEPMAGTAGARAMGDAYFGFYLWAMGRGQARSADRLREMLQRSGFGHVRLRPTRMPLLTRVMVATVAP
jgi:demethylspheroidene O-methyltransferase